MPPVILSHNINTLEILLCLFSESMAYTEAGVCALPFNNTSFVFFLMTNIMGYIISHECPIIYNKGQTHTLM